MALFYYDEFEMFTEYKLFILFLQKFTYSDNFQGGNSWRQKKEEKKREVSEGSIGLHLKKFLAQRANSKIKKV